METQREIDNVTEFIDPGTQADKLYSYRVRAYNKNGNSDYSNTVSVTALPEARR